MVLNFLKGITSVDGGYRAVQASYDKHFQLALRNRIEPISMGLFGALGSRYKLRGKFVSDMVHMLEIAPFMMMGEAARVRKLADYLLVDEIPAQIDADGLINSINWAIKYPEGDAGNTAYELLIASVPYLSDLPIRWVSWLDDENLDRLNIAFEESDKEQT